MLHSSVQSIHTSALNILHLIAQHYITYTYACLNTLVLMDTYLYEYVRTYVPCLLVVPVVSRDRRDVSLTALPRDFYTDLKSTNSYFPVFLIRKMQIRLHHFHFHFYLLLLDWFPLSNSLFGIVKYALHLWEQM